MSTNLMSKVTPVGKYLMEIKENYEKNRFVFIQGWKIETILRFLGASEEDLSNLQYANQDLGEDPTLPFRKSRNGRFLINLQEEKVSRLKFQPFVLSEDEDFVRDDAGMLRHFRGIQDNLQCNTAFQALMKFKAIIISSVDVKLRSNLQKDVMCWVSTVFQLRTITNKDHIGEPAKEGVHSDGVEHTMTTFIRSSNMKKNSAISEVHNEKQQIGVSWDKTDPRFVIGKCQHWHFLDTLIIVDSELKHSVSALNPHDENLEAWRDMILFFTRRPKSEKHPSFKFDSLEEHLEIPLEFSLVNGFD